MTYSLPKGFKLELEHNSGHWVNWKVTDTENDDVWVKSGDVNLVSAKQNFAFELAAKKQDVFKWAAMMEQNLVQLPGDIPVD
jgi:hypothetical protein